MSQRRTATATEAERSAGRFSARLFGGDASGALVELDELAPRISIYRNGGAPVAVEGHQGAPGEEQMLLGTYELVEPVGPETPIYVRSAGGE